jgi:hypothetical protein
MTSIHALKFIVYFTLSNGFHYWVTVFYILHLLYISGERRWHYQDIKYTSLLKWIFYIVHLHFSARGVACIITVRTYSRFSEENKTSKESNIAATSFLKLFTHESSRQSRDFSYRAISKRNCQSQDWDMTFFPDIQTTFCISHRNFICWPTA